MSQQLRLPPGPHVAASPAQLGGSTQIPATPQAGVVPEHVPHAAPPVPHCSGLWLAYGTHVVPSQQPLGQLVASQMQLPLLHRCPVAHA
jgi:hypothetical protein